jgi:type I restriction enzyme S subunit
VPLSAIAEIVQGGRHGLSGNHFVPESEGYPAFGAGGLNGYLPTYEFDRSAVVLSSIGARCGKCFLVSGRWSSLANTQIILPDLAKADPRFLWYQLNDERSWLRSGTAQPFIKPSTVKAREVVLPPLPEQRRLADLLDKADTIRRERRDAIALTEELLRSTFMEMVGPGAAGYSTWPVHSVESLAAVRPNSMRTGPFGSDLLHSEFVGEGVAVLGIDNAVQNRFAWGERRFVTPEKYEQLRRYTVFPGDVIITIMGTTGRSAVVPDDIPTAITTKHLATITLDRTQAEPEFVSQALFRHPAVLSQIEAANRGAIMSGLNLGLIRSLRVPLPPIGRQREFAKATARIRAMTSQRETARDIADELFGSIMARVFDSAALTQPEAVRSRAPRDRAVRS